MYTTESNKCSTRGRVKVCGGAKEGIIRNSPIWTTLWRRGMILSSSRMGAIERSGERRAYWQFIPRFFLMCQAYIRWWWVLLEENKALYLGARMGVAILESDQGRSSWGFIWTEFLKSEGASHLLSGGTGNSKCKHTGVGVCWACSKN